jgi:uncharacterized protein YndB with AHSA1/START domain
VADAEFVVVKAELAARPAKVYRYWTDPDMYPRWMGRSARLDPNPGGEYFVQMNDGFAAMGTFLALDPPCRLEFSWGWAPGAGQAVLNGPQEDGLLPPGASLVRVILADRDGGTALRLEHHDLPNQTLRDNHLVAWQTYLARLAIVVTGADPGLDPHA